MHRLARADAKRHRTVGHPGVVDGVDEDFAGLVGAVDDPNEPLVTRGVRGGDEQRHAVRLPFLGRDLSRRGTHGRNDK